MRKSVLFGTVFLVLMVLLCGMACAESGWKVEGTHYVYYDENGKKVTGKYAIEESVYNFTNEGYLQGNGKVQKAGNGYLYIDSNNNFVTGWQTVEGYKYYFAPSGWAIKELSNIDGVLYLFGFDGKLLIEDWLVTGWPYHSDKQGIVQKGYQKIKDGYYFFDALNRAQSGLQTVEGKIHLFNSLAEDLKPDYYFRIKETRGWTYYNDHFYYCDPKSGEVQFGNQTIDGNKYFFNSDGQLEVGDGLVKIAGYYFEMKNNSIVQEPSNWREIDGSLYYFSDAKIIDEIWLVYAKSDTVINTTGPDKIYGSYYLDETGKMQKNKQYVDENGMHYYFDSNGRRAYGWQVIDGDTYFYVSDKKGFYADVSEWMVRDGEYLYCIFDSDGKLIYAGKEATTSPTPSTTPSGPSGNSPTPTPTNTPGPSNTPAPTPAHTHAYLYLEGREATCTASGLTVGVKCYLCGETIVPQMVIPAKGHTPVPTQAKPATCTEAGYTAGAKCSVCGMTLQQATLIPAKGHQWDAGTVTRAATVFAEGTRTYTCKVCGEKREEVIPLQLFLGYSGWHMENGAWRYGDASGYALLGPQTINGVLYCFNRNGEMVKGWTEVDGKWFYGSSSGALYHNSWMEINGQWYYFLYNGEMATGWINDGADTYCLKDDGTILTGWAQKDGTWYYLNEKGNPHKGWLKQNGRHYYLKPDGAMATGWLLIDGNYYCFDENGGMITGWYQDKESENAQGGGNLWYWFDQDGTMAKGWKEIGGQWEFFAGNGVWQYTWDGT